MMCTRRESGCKSGILERVAIDCMFLTYGLVIYLLSVS